MKKQILLLIAILGLALTSCKKEIHNHYPDHGSGLEKAQSDKVSDTFIQANDWKIIETQAAKNGEVRIWKLQVVGGTATIIIDPVDPTLFWQPKYSYDKVKEGKADILLGSMVIKMNIQRPVTPPNKQ